MYTEEELDYLNSRYQDERNPNWYKPSNTTDKDIFKDCKIEDLHFGNESMDPDQEFYDKRKELWESTNGKPKTREEFIEFKNWITEEMKEYKNTKPALERMTLMKKQMFLSKYNRNPNKELRIKYGE